MASIYAPTAIDLSRVPAPDAIEALDFEVLYSAFKVRFLYFWDTQRAINPSLPVYDTSRLESDPAGIVGEAWSYLRLLDRQRVNDAFKALLAPLAKGSDLDTLVATRNILRRVIVPATSTSPAIMESDDVLLETYLLSFDKPAAGSPAGLILAARDAWPTMLNARVNGYAVHGRRGDRDLVIIGPGGRVATVDEKAAVRSAVTAPHISPEAYGISVLNAVRVEYDFVAVLEIPSGPSPAIVVSEAVDRVRKAAADRLLIGGEIPEGYLVGAAFGASIIKVRVSPNAEVVIEADPYKVPVLRNVDITPEVRG